MNIFQNLVIILLLHDIKANFSFEPETFFFPFDTQNLFISYRFINKGLGILHPVPDKMIDEKVSVDGWKFVDNYSGVIRNKKFYKKRRRF